MDLELFLGQGDRGRNRSNDSFNPLELLMDEFVDQQFGRQRNDRGRHHDSYQDNLDDKASRIGRSLDEGDIDRAGRQIVRNLPAFGNALINRIQRHDRPGYGADLEVLPVIDERGRNADLIRAMFPTRGGLACQDIALSSQYRISPLNQSRPYYCP